MEPNKKDYILAVQAPAYQISAGRFATESAFAIHLKELRTGLASNFDRLVVIAPTLSKEFYDSNREVLGELSEEGDGIAFVPAFDSATTPWRFWTREAVPLWARLSTALSNAGYVHSGLASNIWAPYLALVNVRAWARKIPSAFVADIDFRKISQRFYKTGVWSRKSYVINRCIHDPFKRLQVWLAVRSCDLVLLKSPSMVADFGAGRAHVKDFLDAAHSAGSVVSDAELENRLAQRDPQRPLEVIYFGRFVPYKGLDYVLDAIELAVARGANIHLTLLGSGECLAELRERAGSPGLRNAVTFVPAVKYGPQLFDLLDKADVAVAAPKIEDTPRAALDAMARGLPLVAFDMDYFQNLAEKSGAVALAQWPLAESIARQLVELEKDRPRVQGMARKAVVFARSNTQEIWLRRRIKWTIESCAAKGQPGQRALRTKGPSVLG